LKGDYQFVVPQAATLDAAQRTELLALVQEHGKGLAIKLVNDARATSSMSAPRSSPAARHGGSGLDRQPFVVVYRVSPLTFAIAKRVVKVDHVAMVNLIAGKRAVPELIQNDFTAANIVQQIGPLLPDGAPASP